jgi:hypothetical protein
MSRGETLKSACRLSLSQVLNSRLPVCHRRGLKKPNESQPS